MDGRTIVVNQAEDRKDTGRKRRY